MIIRFSDNSICGSRTTDIVAPILRYSISHLDILFTALLLTALLRLPSPSALLPYQALLFSQAWMF